MQNRRLCWHGHIERMDESPCSKSRCGKVDVDETVHTDIMENMGGSDEDELERKRNK